MKKDDILFWLVSIIIVPIITLLSLDPLSRYYLILKSWNAVVLIFLVASVSNRFVITNIRDRGNSDSPQLDDSRIVGTSGINRVRCMIKLTCPWVMFASARVHPSLVHERWFYWCRSLTRVSITLVRSFDYFNIALFVTGLMRLKSSKSELIIFK